MGRGRPRKNPPRARTPGVDYVFLVEGPGLPDEATLSRATALIRTKLATWWQPGRKRGRKRDLNKICRLVQHNLRLMDQGHPISRSWLRPRHFYDGGLMEILQLPEGICLESDRMAETNQSKIKARDLKTAAELAAEIWSWTHPDNPP